MAAVWSLLSSGDLRRPENDENSPLYEALDAQDSVIELRPSPRSQLQDITHLFPSNIMSCLDKAESVQNRLMTVQGRTRRHFLGVPLTSKRSKAVRENLSLRSRQLAALRSLR